MSFKYESDQRSSGGDAADENREQALPHRETIGQTQHDITSFTNEPSSTRKRIVLEIELASEPDNPAASPHVGSSATVSSLPTHVQETTEEAAVAAAPTGIHLIQNTLLRMLDAQFHQLRQTLTNTGKIHEFRQRLQRLSPREFDVLMLILQGRSRKEIASILGVGFATAAKHQTRIFTKLNVRTSVELIHILSAMCVESCALEFNTPLEK